MQDHRVAEAFDPGKAWVVLSDFYISNTITGPFRAWPVFLSDLFFFTNIAPTAARARFLDFNVDFFDFFEKPTPRF